MEIKGETIRAIEIGNFYFIHDGTKSGHPGLVIQKDDIQNSYLVIRFDSDKPGEIPKTSRGVRHITLLSHPTSSTVINSYIRNRPMLCKRKDIGGKISNMSIHKEDYSKIIEVSKRNPEMAPSLKNKRKK